MIIKYKPKLNKTVNRFKRDKKEIDRKYITISKALNGLVNLSCYYSLDYDDKIKRILKLMDKFGIKYEYMDRGNHKNKLCVPVSEVDKLKTKIILEKTNIRSILRNG